MGVYGHMFIFLKSKIVMREISLGEKIYLSGGGSLIIISYS